jgi:glycine/D-amino acid oxidase-like deaminating enzyme
MLQKDTMQDIVIPWDEHNQQLVSHVHPLDWKNPRPAESYNLVVIGAGTAGLVSAAGAAGLGAKVALIERHLMGGDCLNVGCVPSKALIGAARAAAAVRDAAGFGVRVPAGVGIDFARVMERMRRLRTSIAPNDSAKRFSDLGIDVFHGRRPLYRWPHRSRSQASGCTLKKRSSPPVRARQPRPSKDCVIFPT